ncbi:MAG: hypothetical protein IJ002_03490 [Clostridia bacterium]|nr:hypothetical protein [Clostridia bacterium]
MLKKVLSVVCLVASLMALCIFASATDKMPVAYYTFDFGNLTDYSGNDYHGKAVGGRNLTYESVEGRGHVLELNNKGLKRDTNASGFQIPTDGLTNAESFTLVMDMYVETDGGNQVWFDLSRGKSATDTRHYLVGLLAISSYGMNSEIYSVEVDAAKTRIYNNYTFDKAGEWAQIAYVNDGGAASIYLNGTLVASGDHAKTVKDMLTVDGTTLTIGMATYWNDLSLDAKLDNVAVYDYALTTEELSSPTVPETPVPDGPITPNEPIGDVYFPELGANGLVADYYLLNEDDLSFGEYKSTYIEKNINYPDASKLIAERAGAVNNVATRWTGRIVAPESGYYTFSSYSDNGIKMYIDGEMVLDWWVTQWDVEQISEEIYLEEGVPHEFTFEWMECSGGAHVILRWENDSRVIKTPIPASAFYLPEDSGVPVITEIDASAANLDMNKGTVSGNITIKGENLGNAEKFELVYRNGASASTPLYFSVLSVSDDTATLALPSGVAAGLYHIKPHYNAIFSHSDDSFVVTAVEGEQSRAEHPDPSWQRETFINLNGWWDFAFDADEVGIDEKWYLGEKEYDYKINVPFGWESALSGITATDYRGQAWYNREFTLDSAWLADGKSVNIHFGAVDAKCIVYVNGTEVCSHDGGYTPFEADITEYVSAGENTVTVWVEDKASYGDDSYVALIGKQGHNAPCGYTHTSGIWQTVYLESRSETYLDFAHANSNYKDGSVQFDLSVISDAAQDLTVEFDFESKIWDEEKSADIATGSEFTYSQSITLAAGENAIEIPAIVIENAKLWSDRVPNLYYGTVTLKDASGNVIDSVSTYFGLRQVYTDIYDGRDYEYIFLNGSPIFLAGLLDQGYWREGIYTAPDEAALKYDIAKMKEYGFNMIRKHLKIEDPLQYYWCDKLGMFVWQDMPHATAMNATAEGGEAPGRVLYENTLMDLLKRDYNKPSVMAIMLFNETWGITHTAPVASDGLTTIDWIESLYYKVKEYNSGLLVEDMSPLHNDHIQPTDLNTYHMYPVTYSAAKTIVERYANNAYEGSTHNFYEGYAQEKEPLLNSEFGGVGVSSGDRDVSLCFKYQTDLMRMNQRFNGYVYTEPYDIEYERNGLLTYDRREKLFPYDEIAFGGDMTIADLNQPNHVGVYAEPAKVCNAGAVYSADAIASNWSGNIYENAVLRWRFDATDVYGNNFTTGIGGEQEITYAPYTAEHYTISFTLPDKTCVGTFTVWIEENGEKLAKNFVNVIVDGESANKVGYIGENSVALRTDGGEFEGTGELALTYTLPETFDISTLTSIRLLVEASSVKKNSITNGVSNASTSQTVVGGERPSDMTVYINGIEIDTVYIPDNPRDVRGTLTFNYSAERNSSAEDFGYLVDIVVTADKIDAVRSAITSDGTIKVTYSVETDAENQNGIRLYNDDQGRYALKPTVILNPTELDENNPESSNYRVGATLSDGDSISLRGGAVTVSLSDGVLSLGDVKTTVGDGEHIVSVRVFDTHYQVYADNNPVPVIDMYLDTAYTSNAVITTGEDLTVAPETYEESYETPAIKIDTAEKLIALMNDPDAWGEKYELTETIDLTGLAQTPIGNDTTPFTGTINGNGNTIKGLTLSGAGNVGFFGVAGDCTIKNLTLEGTLTSTGDNAGGFIGKTVGDAVIDGCVNKVVVSGTNNVGGFVGHAPENVDASLAITNSTNEVRVTGSGARVGGFVGFAKSTLAAKNFVFDACINKGNITGAQMVGGLVGRFETGAGNTGVAHKFTDSANYGNIETTSANYTGGIVGLFSFNSGDTSSYVFENLYNQGNITSKAKYNGGIVGYFRSYIDKVGGFYNCMNMGTVYSSITGNAYCGGIIGVGNDFTATATYEIKNMYNAGSVSSADGLLVGAIAGTYHKVSGTITPETCYYLDIGETYSYSVNETKVTTDIYASAETFVGFTTDYWVFTSKGPELKTFHVHTEEIIPAVEPTYTSVGYTEGKKCSVCGEILVAQEEIPMLEGDVPGDIDGDRSTTIKDVLMLIRIVVNKQSIENGDLNGDGKISLIDVLKVMKLVTK